MSTAFKRKLYDELLEWKKHSLGSTAALIEGARRVGKSTLVKEFASKEYDNYLMIDFSNVNATTKNLFETGLQGDVKLFLTKLQLSENKMLIPGKSVIVFDEVQKCPRAREMIKHLVAEGSFDYIETGSLISLKKNVKNIMIPSEEYLLPMHPMDFEEFLWAKGDTASIPFMKGHFDRLEPLDDVWHRKFLDMYREYMVIGGMPQVVAAYLDNMELRDAELQKRTIIRLYHEDIRKIPVSQSIKTERLFDSIPSLLSKTSKIFSPKDIRKGSRTREYYDALDWLAESRIINRCVATRDPSVALKLSLDDSVLKCYLLDTGLLTSMSMGSTEDYSVYRELMMGKLSVNKGMFFENMVAQELVMNNHDLVFSIFNVEKDRRLREVDFITEKNGSVVPIEVKSSYSRRHSSLDYFMKRHKDIVGEAYVVHTGNIEKDGNITYIPIYLAQFL